MRVAPQPGGGLTHATATHDTVHGRVRVAWRIAEGRMKVDVTIPSGTQAEVTLPLHPGTAVVKVTGGSHTWQYDLPEDQGVRPGYTFDTALGTIARDRVTWRSVADAFGKHFPGVPFDEPSPDTLDLTLNAVLDMIPGASDELKADLSAALSTPARAR